MQLRRIILALALTTTVGLTGACAEETDGAAKGSTASATAGGTSAAAAASPSVDAKANTEAVCKGVVAAYDKEKEAITTVLTELLTAGVKDDKAGVAAAKAKGEVVLARLTKAVNVELEKAADPAAKAAIENFVASFSKFLSSMDGVDDPALEAELDKASAEAAKYCPALAG
ncbi:hypothetical protein AB0K00_36285 [Dactylosporangium sp. NPDC049525]|uniref:hypothetical protein n=1 Tax=Dactylosporangium sp. NPDC049525 TaxID=3154730 RepID=UPI003449B145